MYEARQPSFWARCWLNEPVPLPSLPDEPMRQLVAVPAFGDQAAQGVIGAVERWQHLGGHAAYAALGMRFEPADVGQLSIRVPPADSGRWLVEASFGLAEASQTLARELGPGHLRLTHVQGDEVDSSPAAFASTATALAFVLVRTEPEVTAAADSLLRLPCQFEMLVKIATRIPESVAARSGYSRAVVTLGGPYLKGDLRCGDQLTIRGDGPLLGRVVGFPRLNLGADRGDWILVDVEDIDEFEPRPDTIATGPHHWRSRQEQ